MRGDGAVTLKGRATAGLKSGNSNSRSVGLQSGPIMSPAPDVIVRPATPADLPRIGRLGALLVDTHHGFDSRRFLAASDGTPARYASFLGTQLENPDVSILVAEESGEVVGYAYASIEGYDYMSLRGPAALLQDLIVEPGHRRRGVGRRLLDAMLDHLKARGAPLVVLSTAHRNETAQRLFAQAGFRPTMVEMTRELDEEAS